jgi:methyl-accepting chemotaxis protein
LSTLAVLIVVVLLAMTRLGDMQDAGFARSQTEARANDASWLGAQFYQLFADAIINRHLDESRKEFAELRATANTNLERLAREADTPDEKQSVANAQKAVDRVAEIFEKSLLPALNDQNRVSAQIASIDEEIDRDVRDIRVELAKVAKSMSAEAFEADRDFDATRSATLTRLAIIGVLANAGAGRRRALDRALDPAPAAQRSNGRETDCRR